MRPSRAPARVGPNAAIQLAAAINDLEGKSAAREVFMHAGLLEWLDHPPTEMIAEGDAVRLHAAVRQLLPAVDARAVLSEAGRRTGAYILAHRIPRPAQTVLKALPRALAMPLLFGAIEAHAWTFVGSGVFHARGARLRIGANPLVAERGALEPQCVWHEGVFETLVRALVAARAAVTEVECCAMGAPECVFETTLAPRRSNGMIGEPMRA